MKRTAATGDSTGLEILLFRVGGVCFGVEADQVERVDSCGEGAQEGSFWFHDLVDFGEWPVVYRAPTLLLVKIAGEAVGVVIDAVRDIAEFGLDAIRPFPPLVEPFVLPKGMWGVLQLDEEIVPLLDFQRLRHRIVDLRSKHP